MPMSLSKTQSLKHFGLGNVGIRRDFPRGEFDVRAYFNGLDVGHGHGHDGKRPIAVCPHRLASQSQPATGSTIVASGTRCWWTRTRCPFCRLASNRPSRLFGRLWPLWCGPTSVGSGALRSSPAHASQLGRFRCGPLRFDSSGRSWSSELPPRRHLPPADLWHQGSPRCCPLSNA